MIKREQWQSSLGFVWAAAGSAVGLGSIWRFPYIVGANGGAAFILLFVFFLFLVSIPIFISELAIGKETNKNPADALSAIGNNRIWYKVGLVQIIAGLLISSFYSVIGGWTLGFFYEAYLGNLHFFHSLQESSTHFQNLQINWVWGCGFHFLFLLCASFILWFGVRKGIEKTSKFMMPMLLIVLVLLTIKGLTLPGSWEGVRFIFVPKWEDFTFSTVLLALGQAFFCLSLGQGTMIAYGSYLGSHANILKVSFSIAISVLLVSLLAGLAIFTIVFSVGVGPSSGESLLFEALPLAFSQLLGGYWLALGFFLLIFIAAITSQISAMEPAIAYLMDAKRLTRKQAVLSIGAFCFLLGIPSALSFSAPNLVSIGSWNFFEIVSSLSINIMIPFGGLCTVLLVGWFWGTNNLLCSLGIDQKRFKKSFIFPYLKLTIRYLVPVVIGLVFLNAVGFL